MNVYIYEVMGVVDDMLINMVNIEIGICGYVVFGNEVFFEFYLGGCKGFSKVFDQVKVLIVDNLVQ